MRINMVQCDRCRIVAGMRWVHCEDPDTKQIEPAPCLVAPVAWVVRTGTGETLHFCGVICERMAARSNG